MSEKTKKTKKRKYKVVTDPDFLPASKRRKAHEGRCILHGNLEIEHGNFVSFSSLRNPDERISYLVSIRDKRLAEPLDSSTRMSEICTNIPDEIGQENMSEVGYHRG